MRIQEPDHRIADTGGVLVPGDATKVAAFGDSLMWGQGLPRDKRFSALITQRLPELMGKPARIVWDASRSGAKITPRGRRVVDLRDGRHREVGDDDTTEFMDTFPRLFRSPAERRAFRGGADQSAAARLHGEVPATFPTVRGQVRMLPAALGAEVDIALVDGGVNDLDVEDILNPQVKTGDFIRSFSQPVEQVAHGDVLQLLRDVRSKCPNAVILYFGFFPAVSEASSVAKVRALFKHEFDDDFRWWLNKWVWEDTDVRELIDEAQTRGEWFHAQFEYWTRRAIVDANRDDRVRGPGIVFVPSTFRRRNALFAPEPMLWDDYTDPAPDPARVQRVQACPRFAQLGALRTAYYRLGNPSTPGLPDAMDLRGSVDGPVRLRNALGDLADEWNPGAVREAAAALEAEIGRIQRATIASFSHPNERGAQRYADSAITRLRAHRARVDAALARRTPGEPPHLDTLLRRFNLRGPGALVGDVGLIDVDSIRVDLETRPHSSSGFGSDVWIVFAMGDDSSRSYRLNLRYDVGSWRVEKYDNAFEPGATGHYTVSADGQLHIDSIRGVALLIGETSDRPLLVGELGRELRPWALTLELNGIPVLEKRFARDVAFGPGDTIDLEYPAPLPASFAAPTPGPTKQVPRRLDLDDAPAPSPATGNPVGARPGVA